MDKSKNYRWEDAEGNILSTRRWLTLVEAKYSLKAGRLTLAKDSDVVTDGVHAITIGEMRKNLEGRCYACGSLLPKKKED